MLVRLYRALSGFAALRAASCLTLALFAASFPAARLLSGRIPQALAGVMSFMSAVYLSPMLCAFLLTLAADAFRLINNVVVITRLASPYSARSRLCVVAFIAAASIVITLAGTWNANNPHVMRHHIPNGGLSLRIAMLSDIHLGQFTGPRYLAKLVSLVNGVSPDIVLILGDTADGPEFLRGETERAEAANLLSSFKSRFGTWAVMGNHDYYAGHAEVVNFLTDAGVNLLRDEAEVVDGKFVLVGRDDRAGLYYGRSRGSISDIASAVISGDERYPLIVMDHQPFALGDAAEAGALLQLSGHTHRGQLFPVNLIVARLFEKSYGLYKKENTHYYISSGAGVWGTPVRTVGRPEVVVIDIGEKAEDN
jgi:predicted MPP superfamily phosphohydrolase